HIDGLFDPAGYLRRLQAAVFQERLIAFLGDGERAAEADALQEWARAEALLQPSGPVAQPLFVVVEKILSGAESLPAWPADGTTGYDFLNDASRLFVNPRNAPTMRGCYRPFTALADSFAD